MLDQYAPFVSTPLRALLNLGARSLWSLIDCRRYCGVATHLIGLFIPCMCFCPVDDMPAGYEAYHGPITWICCLCTGWWPGLICPCDKRPLPQQQTIVINTGVPQVQVMNNMTTHPTVVAQPQPVIQTQPMVQLVPPPVQMQPVAQPIQQAAPVMAQPVGGSAASAAMAAQQQRVQSLGVGGVGGGGGGGGSSGANLETMTVKELRGIAAAQGVSPDDIENARDGDNPRQDLIALIKSSSAVANLDSMTVKEIRGIAAEQGVSADDIERARDGDNPKQDLIALIKGKGMQQQP